MPLRSGLLDEIRQALGQAVSPSLTSQSHVSDIYEGYIFSILLQAARLEGAQVSLSSIQRRASSRFVFRTSPGYLNSQRHDYGYAQVFFQRCPPLEVHVGVRVAGPSKTLHECDVSVIDQGEAELCRRVSQTVAPRSARVLVAIEVKYYTTALPLHVGRGFLGLVGDLTAKNAFFVFNSRAETVERLLAHKGRQWEHNVLPAHSRAVTRLTNSLQVVFRDYQARTRT